MQRSMKVLTALTYYVPHVSGLTVYARRVVKALVERGHQVTVLTSHYDHHLPREEEIDGARVVRVPVAFRFSKGVFMPTLPWHALRLSLSHDVVYLHTPQFEAFVIAGIARLIARKRVVTYHHCDIILPSRLLRLLFWLPIAGSHRLAAMLSHQVIAGSRDYAESSPFLRKYKGELLTIYPPVPDLTASTEPLDVRAKVGSPNGKLVGFVGRLSEDKGVQYLIEAVPRVLTRFPDARFVLVGEQEKVVGETVYERLRPRLDELGEHVVALGVLPEGQLAQFYEQCDVLVLPSINSTEAFGMVQVEAMLKGTPVVATDLPGVRVPIEASRMGETVPPRDSRALSEAILRVLEAPERYAVPRERIAELFDPEKTYDFYEDLFASLLGIDPFSAEVETGETND